MTDSEKLNLILSEIQGMKAEIHELNRRTTNIEAGMADIHLVLET